MRELWLIYAIVSLADLTLTCLYLSPELEANPIASWIWSTFGYFGLITFKILAITCIAYPCWRIVAIRSVKAAKFILYFGIVITSLTCLLFGATII